MTATIDLAPDTLTGVEWCEHAGINWLLLQAELEFVTLHPELHDQTVWAKRTDCGTSCCVAGWTVIHAGVGLYWNLAGFAHETVSAVPIFRRAADLLGLCDADADRLFDEDNNVADLWRIAYEITRGAVVRPALPAV